MSDATNRPILSFDFGGRHVLVTGGTSGIGAAIAAAFAGAGAAVTITGTRSAPDDYDADLSRFTYRTLDTREPASIEALAASVDRLDVLVNNAGANLPGFRSEWEPDVFEETLRINLSGAFRLALGVKDRLAASTIPGGASVVNLACCGCGARIWSMPRRRRSMSRGFPTS